MRQAWKASMVIVAGSLLAMAACTAPPRTPAPAQNPSAQNPSAQHPPDYVATVQPRIAQAMKDNAIPGAVVLVSSPGRGDWVGTFGTGVIGREQPLTAADHFRVGSNTKTMTATVILQLVQEGKLRLDDPVAKYRAGVPNGDKITIAQLAEMRSGLYSYSFDLGFNQTLDRDPGKVWTPDELLAVAFAHPVNFAPGERFEYCNTNTILLGVIIERLTGEPVERVFQERIFTPLGLRETSLPARTDSAIPDPHPHGYAFGTNVETIDSSALPPAEQAAAVAGTLKPNDATTASPSWAWTAGGAISTVGDLAVYVKALVGGGLLDEQTQKMRLDSIAPTDPANPSGAGYGFGIARFGPLIGHDGQLPGFMSFMGYDPKTGLTITIATNLSAVPSGDGAALTLLKTILPVFYPDMSIPGDPASAPGSAKPTG